MIAPKCVTFSCKINSVVTRVQVTTNFYRPLIFVSIPICRIILRRKFLVELCLIQKVPILRYFALALNFLLALKSSNDLCQTAPLSSLVNSHQSVFNLVTSINIIDVSPIFHLYSVGVILTSA